MTQGEKLSIVKKKAEALTEYCNLCIHLNEVPRQDQVILINGCDNTSALREVIEIYKSRIQ